MKIFYAVQATGNGHISRATELVPLLQKYGDVDVFLSGSNYSLKSNLPIAYRSKGLSLAYNNETGSIDIQKTIQNISIRKIWNEAKFLPVEKYDLVVNDFESITSLACRLKKVKSIHLGHQASFVSKKVPRPSKTDFWGEWVLRNYAAGTENYGFHFREYDNNIYNPIIKNSILEAEPSNKGHFTIYLGQYDSSIIIEAIKELNDFKFEIFCSKSKDIIVNHNYKILPVSQELFTQSLLSCTGIITGAGFETPAEALYLNKKLMVIPLKGQYEQLCNAEALKDFNVTVIDKLNENFKISFEKWIDLNGQKQLILSKTAVEIIEEVVEGKPQSKLASITANQWNSPFEISHQQIVSQ
ncbi:MAG: hypothetical protein RLZZ390_609 [Bacteroidota bacterium]|jgi:uncharacterized protein (TIGR00661 family)